MADAAQNPLKLMRVVVRAEREIAYDSPDHLVPWGTGRDNTRQRRFNQKMYRLFAARPGSLWVMDLGCSGGGFVKDCLDDGCLAVGLEGSDLSRRLKRAEWRSIPEYLFTADLTRKIEVLGQFEDGERPLLFDVITAWEVMEHIHERDLGMVADNVKRHLRPGGLWIMSIAVFDDFQQGVNLHQTVQPREWWIRKFQLYGLVHLPGFLTYFNTQYVRGPKNPNSPAGFHLVLTNDPSRVPKIPRESVAVRLYDRWLGSRLQKLLRYAVVGV